MNWFEALLLGILQGLTEFLPISSSGHLELGSYFLKTDNADNLLFTIIVHFATAISILYVFRNDIKKPSKEESNIIKIKQDMVC